MDFLRFLQQESGAAGRRVAVITFIGGLVSGLIVTLILKAAGAATDKGESFRYLLMFVLALIAILAAKRYSLRHTNRLTETIVESLRERITEKIRRSELLFFENTGTAQFTSLLTKETQTISATAGVAINAASAIVMLLVAFFLIAYLSIPALVLTLVAVGVGVVAYRISLEAAGPEMQETIRVENTYFDMIHHLLAGFKELKMDARKNQDFYQAHLQPLSARVRDMKIATNNRFVNTTLITHGAFYALLGVVIFLLPKLAVCDDSVVMQIAAVILFMFGPLQEVVGVIPFVARAGAAIKAVEALEKQLDDEIAHAIPVDYTKLPAPWPVEEIEVRDVIFTYPGEGDAPGYTLGPVSVKFRARETAFIMGGNGSGKSTFLKILTGLYQPTSGQILINGTPVAPHQYHRYRNLFSIIFTDFHLFDRLYGLAEVDEAKLDELLHEMELSSKTRYYEGRFSHLQLSTGQRKRLALIVAILEKKSVLVCDEWAADQDPIFRKHFYEIILPELKRQGKTIIAATHDDRYFHTADRLLKMEYGKFVDA